MTNPIIDPPFSRLPKPVWLPFLTVGVTLFGILWLDWDLRPVIFLFQCEVVLMVVAALVRMLFALDGQPVDALISKKTGLFFAGLAGGGMAFLFSKLASEPHFMKSQPMVFGNYFGQIGMLAFGYAGNLAANYFRNGRYKKASPGFELGLTFMHIWVLVAFMQGVTVHLVPSFSVNDPAKWVAGGVVGMKFLVDWLFAKYLSTTVD